MTDPKQVLKKIVKIVFGVHLLLLIFLMLPTRKKAPKTIYTKRALKENVRIIQKPKPKKIAVAPKKVAPKPVVKPPVKKQAPKPTEKVITKKTSTPAKKALPKIQEMPQAVKQEVISIDLPKAIEKLSIEEEVEEDFIEGQSGYADYLKQMLMTSLKLKPNTFVSIDLTLNKNGEFICVKHFDSSDTITKEYVLQQIPKLNFSRFFGDYAKLSQHTFELRIIPNEENE